MSQLRKFIKPTTTDGLMSVIAAQLPIIHLSHGVSSLILSPSTVQSVFPPYRLSEELPRHKLLYYFFLYSSFPSNDTGVIVANVSRNYQTFTKAFTGTTDSD